VAERRAKQPIELRFRPRYRLEVRVTVTATRAEGPVSLVGRSTDISEGGLGCTLTGELVEGESVTAEFSLPLEPEAFRLRATVRHRAGLHYGLEFLFPTPEQQGKIRLLARALPRVA
jgi:PilZ domain-containing protein